MLILTRKRGEKIYIGDNIVIEITGFENYKDIKQVQIGIDAPKDISIKRSSKIGMHTNDSDDIKT